MMTIEQRVKHFEECGAFNFFNDFKNKFTEKKQTITNIKKEYGN